MATSEEKLDRKLRGPGLVEIVFSVILSLALGGVLGATYLVFKPVEKRNEKSLAKETLSDNSLLYHTVRFVEGGTTGGGGWAAKHQSFVSGQPGGIALSEAELNALIAKLAPPPPAPPKPAVPLPATNASLADKAKEAKDTKPPAKTEKPTEPAFVTAKLMPGVVNFHMRDGGLQVAAAGNYSIVGLEISPLIQMYGGFAKGADGFEFQPTEFYIGSLPAHKIPGLPGWLLGKMLTAQKTMPEDLKTAWKKLGNLAVEGDTLRLTLP